MTCENVSTATCKMSCTATKRKHKELQSTNNHPDTFGSPNNFLQQPQRKKQQKTKNKQPPQNNNKKEEKEGLNQITD